MNKTNLHISMQQLHLFFDQYKVQHPLTVVMRLCSHFLGLLVHVPMQPACCHANSSVGIVELAPKVYLQQR